MEHIYETLDVLFKTLYRQGRKVEELEKRVEELERRLATTTAAVDINGARQRQHEQDEENAPLIMQRLKPAEKVGGIRGNPPND